MTRRRPQPRAVVVAALAAALGAPSCDRLPEAVIFPEFELTYSFESGLDGWTVSSADLGAGSWAAEPSVERATDGTRSARLSLANPEGAGKGWITRELQLTPKKSYTAEISVDLATADHGVADAWKLILTARETPPAGAASLDFQGDTSSGRDTATGVTWVEKRFVLPVQGDDEGKLYLSLGVWGTTPGARTYWVDRVQVVLTRTN
ncbi:MAG: hypothetical protein FIA95_01335 [Gemmatimonadetes bacterium]|nr:hypothetical protein [Gemmatimonadota bacterium]